MPTVVVKDHGHEYHVPQGGWVTKAQREHPDMHTTVIVNNNTEVHNTYVNVNRYYENEWGPDWYHHHYGFYCGDAFWLGFAMGSMVHHDYYYEPIYVISPVTGYPCGRVLPPSNEPSFNSEMQADLAVLSVMDQPTEADPTSGLYPYQELIDPNNPGERISPEYAYNTLRHGGSIYFHPPNGAYEQITGLGDLKVYLYSKENRG